MMQETLISGTARKAEIPGWMAAGKTGTSQDFRDAWFVGYTANLVTGVWLGNDDNSPTRKATGGGLPVEVWTRFMRIAHQGVPVASLPNSQAPGLFSNIAQMAQQVSAPPSQAAAPVASGGANRSAPVQARGGAVRAGGCSRTRWLARGPAVRAVELPRRTPRVRCANRKPRERRSPRLPPSIFQVARRAMAIIACAVTVSYRRAGWLQAALPPKIVPMP